MGKPSPLSRKWAESFLEAGTPQAGLEEAGARFSFFWPWALGDVRSFFGKNYRSLEYRVMQRTKVADVAQMTDGTLRSVVPGRLLRLLENRLS